MKSIALLATLCFLLVSPLLSLARAEEASATYPPLPASYSSIRVYDRQGRYAGRILPEERHWVSLDRIPVFLQNAVVAIEDTRFYDHGGIDLRGIARAIVKDVAKRSLAEGGSTITQQLVKNRHLTNEKSIDRKMQEGLLALEYESKYTKKQILEMYFNEIYFGNGAWGIAQAALTYYDKTPAELTEAECAVLAGVPKNPGKYNPQGKPADVQERKNTVLARMAELKIITARQKQQLSSAPNTPVQSGQAPQYISHVRRKLIDTYGPQIITRGGLEVMAAMDLNLQKQAEKILSEGVQKISPELQGALLCLDPQTGDILAFAGGVDYTKNAFNRALFAKRQPGSAIKPLIYAAALDRGITAGSRWDDTPAEYDRGNGKTWKPLNYNGESFGTSSLREALAHSNNVVTVKVLDTLGVPYFLDYARALGLSLRSPNDLSLALGTDEVTLHDLALAYAPLANAGLRPSTRTIQRIYDRNTKVWTDNPVKIEPVLDPATAYVTTRMLQDVMTYGTAKSLAKFAAERPAAGKTGTTDEYKDAWFIGYTPQMITGVWVGNDQPKSQGKGFTGGRAAAPIWERFMRTALADKPAVDFTQPATVDTQPIDIQNGLPATPGCPNVRMEYFLIGTAPKTYCPDHGGPPEEVMQQEAEPGLETDATLPVKPAQPATEP